MEISLQEEFEDFQISNYDDGVVLWCNRCSDSLDDDDEESEYFYTGTKLSKAVIWAYAHNVEVHS